MRSSILTFTIVLFWFSVRVQVEGCLLTRISVGIDVKVKFIEKYVSSFDNRLGQTVGIPSSPCSSRRIDTFVARANWITRINIILECGCNCVRSVDPFIKTVLVLFVARLATIGDPDVISAQTPFSLSHPKDKRLRRSRESLRIFSPPSRFPPSRCPSELKTYRPSPRPFSRLPLL